MTKKFPNNILLEGVLSDTPNDGREAAKKSAPLGQGVRLILDLYKPSFCPPLKSTPFIFMASSSWIVVGDKPNQRP